MRKAAIILCFVFILGMCLGCGGTRHVSLSKESTSVKTESNSTSQSNSTGNRTINLFSELELKSEKEISAGFYNQNTEKEVVEKFGDQGQLVERTTRAKSSSSKDNTKTKEQSTTAIQGNSTLTAGFENHSEISGSLKKDSLDNSLDKKAAADKTFVKNVGGWGVVIGIVLIIAVVLYFYYPRKSGVPKMQYIPPPPPKKSSFKHGGYQPAANENPSPPGARDIEAN